VADPKAKVIITAQDQTGPAIRSAERNLKSLLKQGELVGKFFRGGAVVAAIVAFERLAEKAQEAAEAIGDKGTARSLKALNTEIDNLKSKGFNLIGKALGETFVLAGGNAGELTKITTEIARLQHHLDGLDLAGVDFGREGLIEEIRLLEKRRELYEKNLPSGERTRAPGRGGRSVFTEAEGILAEMKAEEEAAKAAEQAAKEAARELKAAREEAERLDFNASLVKSEDAVAKRVEDYYGGVAERAGMALEIEEQSLKGIEEITVQMERSYEIAQKQNEEMSVFAEQAARNIQSSFAQFLFDPLEDGFKGMVVGFVNAIRQMVAEAAAAQLLGGLASTLGGIFGGLFGATTVGPSGGSSPLSYGGARAGGGPVHGGTAYMVGEQGPELFVPSSSGSIVPNGGGGTTIAPQYNIDARGATTDLVKALPSILAENNRQLMLAFRDAKTRGAIA
jgi:hypothetical protein